MNLTQWIRVISVNARPRLQVWRYSVANASSVHPSPTVHDPVYSSLDLERAVRHAPTDLNVDMVCASQLHWVCKSQEISVCIIHSSVV